MPADTARPDPRSTETELESLRGEQEQIYDALIFWDAARRLQKTRADRDFAERHFADLKCRARMIDDALALARGESQP